MKRLKRRQFVKLGLTAAAAAVLGSTRWSEPSSAELTSGRGGLRYSCFYQVSGTTLAYYLDPTRGLPRDGTHVHVFAQSHATAYADRRLAETIHAGGPNFAYAPCFDLHEHRGWYTADDAQLAAWGRAFRDAALAAGADYFGFNELPTTASDDAQLRSQVMGLLQYLSEPDAAGRHLQGIFFMTHRPSMPANWRTPASDFWESVHAACALVVAEHYHSYGFICANTEAYLMTHFFAMHDWLARSGEPAKVAIAKDKFTVLHSSRYGPGSSGWQGGNSDVATFAQFRRYLSKCAWLTRNGAGGIDRISFAPTSSATTELRVHRHIRRLINWHYNQDRDAQELLCVGGRERRCVCSV